MQAEFLGVPFVVSEKTLRSLSTIGLKREAKYTETEARDGLPQLDVKGFEPQKIAVEYRAHIGMGTGPLAEYNRWKAKLGQSGPFLLGGSQFGVDVFVLMDVRLSGATLSNAGKLLTGTISLQLEQDIIVTEKKVTP
jgi:hypothetical protein